MIRLGDILESFFYPEDARFGIGAVDANDAVHFKEISRDTFGTQAHGMETNPWGRCRFRYKNGEVEWSDCAWPSKDVQHRVENELARRELPFTKHTSIYDGLDEPEPEPEGDYD